MIDANSMESESSPETGTGVLSPGVFPKSTFYIAKIRYKEKYGIWSVVTFYSQVYKKIGRGFR